MDTGLFQYSDGYWIFFTDWHFLPTRLVVNRYQVGSLWQHAQSQTIQTCIETVKIEQLKFKGVLLAAKIVSATIDVTEGYELRVGGGFGVALSYILDFSIPGRPSAITL